MIVVPYNTTAEEILQLHPDGVMFQNGPGDPKDVPEAIRNGSRNSWKSSAVWDLSWASIVCS